jgi:hypothetical protein
MKLKKKSTRKINKNPIGNDKIRKKNQFKKKRWKKACAHGSSWPSFPNSNHHQ